MEGGLVVSPPGRCSYPAPPCRYVFRGASDVRLIRVGTCQIDLRDEAHSGCVARELRNVIREGIN